MVKSNSPLYEIGETFDKEDSRNSKRRNKTWRRNNALITRAYLALYQEHGHEPTLDELSEATGISVTSVHKHYADLKIADFFEDTKKEFGAFLPDVMLAIVNSAVKGNSRSQELYLRVVAEWNPDIKFDGNMKLEDGLAQALLAARSISGDDEE